MGRGAELPRPGRDLVHARHVSEPGLWLRSAGALALIAGALFALQYLLRLVSRGGSWPRRGPRLIEVIETVPLSSAVALHVVRIVDRHYAVGSAHGTVNLIGEVRTETLDTGSGSPPS